MNFKFKGKMVLFATGNIHKFNEASMILSEYGLASGMLKEKVIEIQNDNLKNIAAASALDAFQRCHLPLIVEDAGLFVEALNGFPGAYAAFTYKTVGNTGLLKLMENVKDRKAIFRSAIAYCDEDSDKITCFEGESKGEITTLEQVKKSPSGFGFDPIFRPFGSTKTFAEMTLREKNRFSHRAQALRSFADWYSEQR